MRLLNRFQFTFEDDTEFFAKLNWIPFVAGVFVVMVIISIFPTLGIPSL